MHSSTQIQDVCQSESVKLVNTTTGEIAGGNCHSWECVCCRQKMARRWAVRTNLAEPLEFWLITNVPADLQAYRSGWARFMRAIRKGYRSLEIKQEIEDFYRFSSPSQLRFVNEDDSMELARWAAEKHPGEYVRGFEEGTVSGMRHVHVAWRGVPVPRDVLSLVAHRFGFGYIAHVEDCYGAGPGYYIGKYLTKSGPTEGIRKMTASRRFMLKEFKATDWKVLYSTPRMDKLLKPGFRLEDLIYLHGGNWDAKIPG